MTNNRLTPTEKSAPEDRDWGEKTYQSNRKYPIEDEPTDAAEIRTRYGIGQLDISDFTKDGEEPSRIVYPDLLIHEHDAERTRSEGGTGGLLVGQRGCGKSTLLSQITARLMDENDEIVVWRGSPMRSEWLRLKRWVTLWLPEGADVDATWMTEGGDSPTDDVENLDDVVRDVFTYEDPLDLLEQLGEGPAGTINVVYPDPTFSGCTELTAETNRPGAEKPLPFRPSWETDENESPTPLQHWWFAFILAAIEHSSHYEWLSLVFDELGDLVPEDAKNSDGNRTYDKISLFRSCMSDSRRVGFSPFGAIHHEENIHHKGRREWNWRISMPDGRPNPRTSRMSSIPVGFETVPMESDVISGFDVGTGLCYAEWGATWFSWKEIEFEPEDKHRWLKIRVDEPETGFDVDEEADLQLQFDDQIFAEWQNAHAHRLVVKDPGSGQLSVESGTVLDPLESPIEALEFDEPQDVPGGKELTMTGEAGQITVARIPVDGETPNSANGIRGVGADD
ncbi:hypothetical protein [Halobellus inordinatus]|uniref:hypothetical protein n=1 Tax=Halobellus inordinatus TaxID=1126236 RepID=UPI002109259C|nr:hypothetical protein [Halobellus inordinatus]